MPPVPETLTVKQYAELYPRYLASERAQKKSPKTINLYDLSLRTFRDWLSENASESDEIVPLTVQEWTDSICERVSPNSANLYYGSVDRFFKWAKKLKLVSENPMPEDGRPKGAFKKKEIPTKDEIKRLLDPANMAPMIVSKNPIRNYTIVAFLILTGLRSDEMRSLTLSDLNFAQGYVRVRNGKGGKERNAPFPQKAQKIVRDYLAAGIRPDWCTDDDLLFGTHAHGAGETEIDRRSTPRVPAKPESREECDSNETNREDLWHKFDVATLGRLVHRYGKRVLGRDIHPHMLRHCAASVWDDHDVDIRDVQKALGHSSLRTTERIYVHYLDANKAANAVNAALDVL